MEFLRKIFPAVQVQTCPLSSTPDVFLLVFHALPDVCPQLPQRDVRVLPLPRALLVVLLDGLEVHHDEEPRNEVVIDQLQVPDPHLLPDECNWPLYRKLH